MLLACSPRSSTHHVGVQVRAHDSAPSMKGKKGAQLRCCREEQQQSSMHYELQARGGAVCSGRLAQGAHCTMLAFTFGRTICIF